MTRKFLVTKIHIIPEGSPLFAVLFTFWNNFENLVPKFHELYILFCCVCFSHFLLAFIMDKAVLLGIVSRVPSPQSTSRVSSLSIFPSISLRVSSNLESH